MSLYPLGIFFMVIYYFITAFVSLAIVALELIGQWKVFVKMGEPGWKGIIPYYSQYVLFQKVWNVKKFWTYIISLCTFIVPYTIGILMTIFGIILATEGGPSAGVSGVIMLIVGILFLLAAFGAVIFSLVIGFGMYKRLAHSFGKSTAFAWGLLFIPPVFLMILGFDKSEYIPVRLT